MALPPLPLGPFDRLSEAERRHSLRETLQQIPELDDVWVFAYGSLMWNPCFAVAERHHATLHGYSRAFSIFTVEARGTPAQPGLGLALQPGGTCEGFVLRIDDDALDAGLDSLWAREMLTGIYSPAWVSVAATNRDITAVTFVVNAIHAQYARDIPLAEQVQLIRGAHGKFGSCRDYLADTVAALRSVGVDDAQMTSLLELVDG
ncbi:MAG: gamma-glutamylcyclotransferase [Gammaproteobacteria bacterium]|nr:gamma-glutamylcyclotransferase [Gammaproteobacteria bacterium]